MNKDKIHTTNYYNTFIEVAEDTKVTCGTIPISKTNNKSVAEWQYEIIVNNPYKNTSDDIFFKVFAKRKNLTEQIFEEARKTFFSKGQPCFRSSPLAKTYGFGIHADNDGKIAIFGMETEMYKQLQKDSNIKKLKAMRTSKK